MVRREVDQLKTNKPKPTTNSTPPQKEKKPKPKTKPQPLFVTPLLAVNYKEETLKDCMSACQQG